jgi:hypothetical protein
MAAHNKASLLKICQLKVSFQYACLSSHNGVPPRLPAVSCQQVALGAPAPHNYWLLAPRQSFRNSLSLMINTRGLPQRWFSAQSCRMELLLATLQLYGPSAFPPFFLSCATTQSVQALLAGLSAALWLCINVSSYVLRLSWSSLRLNAYFKSNYRRFWGHAASSSSQLKLGTESWQKPISHVPLSGYENPFLVIDPVFLCQLLTCWPPPRCEVLLQTPMPV